MPNDDVEAATSRGERLNKRLDVVEPVAVPVALGALIVIGVVGLVWGAVGDAMKQGLAVAILGVPLLFLYRSVHRQTTVLAEHISASATPPITAVSLYEGLKTVGEIKRGTGHNALLLARTGSRYLSDLRNIDPQWGAMTVVLTDDKDAALWSTRPIKRGWAQNVEVLISEAASDVHYLVVGDDVALLGFYDDHGSGRVDYAHSLLVNGSADETRTLIDALRAHFGSRQRSACVLRPVDARSRASRE